MTAGIALFLLDAVLIAAGWPLALWLGGQAGFGTRAGLEIPLFALSCLGFLYALGLYRRDALADLSRSAGRLPLAVCLAIITGSSACLVLGISLPPNIFAATALWLGGCTLSARLVFVGLRRRAMFRPHLLVIGAGKRAWDLVWVLRNQGRSLHYDVTFVHEDQFGPIDPRLAASSANRILHASSNLLEIAQRIGADQIVVAPDERRGMTLASLITCRTAGFPVSQYASFLEKEVGRIDIKRPDLDWVLYSEGFDGGAVNGVLKRAVDILGSALILVCSLGFLLSAMLAVWLCDRGPIFYRQERVTLGRRKFNILKLRTMRIDSEKNGPVWAAAKDARITPVGAFLRRSRLDELPQLFNVLRGDMSLVGPRPERPGFVDELARQLPLYQERHAVKAGLTGWAQVNYPYGASLDDARSKLSFDLYYVKRSSVLFDIKILAQTLRVVMFANASGAR